MIFADASVQSLIMNYIDNDDLLNVSEEDFDATFQSMRRLVQSLEERPMECAVGNVIGTPRIDLGDAGVLESHAMTIAEVFEHNGYTYVSNGTYAWAPELYMKQCFEALLRIRTMREDLKKVATQFAADLARSKQRRG